jgi:hypothetical protein
MTITRLRRTIAIWWFKTNHDCEQRQKSKQLERNVLIATMKYHKACEEFREAIAALKENSK